MAETKTKKTYIETVGRRKEAHARVRITPANKTSILINEKELQDYFPTDEMQTIVKSPFSVEEEGVGDGHYTITALVSGGGVHAQAEAVRHGISRALVEERAEARKPLKKAGFLKRDPRSKERRKFGLKKARKSPQWSKR